MPSISGSARIPSRTWIEFSNKDSDREGRARSAADLVVKPSHPKSTLYKSRGSGATAVYVLDGGAPQVRSRAIALE
jgi:hypothetical protein